MLLIMIIFITFPCFHETLIIAKLFQNKVNFIVDFIPLKFIFINFLLLTKYTHFFSFPNYSYLPMESIYSIVTVSSNPIFLHSIYLTFLSIFS